MPVMQTANMDWVKSIINTCLHKHFQLYKYVSFFLLMIIGTEGQKGIKGDQGLPGKHSFDSIKYSDDD